MRPVQPMSSHLGLKMIQPTDFLECGFFARIGSPFRKRTYVVPLTNVVELHSRRGRKRLRPELAVDYGRMGKPGSRIAFWKGFARIGQYAGIQGI